MKKTVLQELLEELNKGALAPIDLTGNVNHQKGYKRAYNDLKAIIETFSLEKEKQQIIEANRQGKCNQIECGIYGNNRNVTPETYFEKTFNNQV